VRLRSLCCHHIACVMFVVVWRCRVECIYHPCTHAHTHKKKKIALVIRGCRRNEEARYIWYQSGFDPGLGIATAFVDMI
jgi:hypothetical protein